MGSQYRPRVLVADDHEILSAALVSFMSPLYEIVAQCSNGAETMAGIERTSPDLVVLDISLPDTNGLELMDRIRAAGYSTPCVMLTQHESPEIAFECLRKGASAYVLKRAAPKELFSAMQAALKGQQYISHDLRDAVRLCEPASAGAKVHGLTPRQRDVLRVLASGKSMKECAQILGISPRTVEYYKYQMMRDLGLQSSVELVQYAMRSGLVVSGPPPIA
jgi:DNA-binding NarL/FixJ family response regulator